MKLKEDCWIAFIFLIVIFNSCSAVIVTVGDNGPVPEGNAARLTCDFERTLIGSTNHPTFRWEEMILGSPVVISVYQNGGGAVQSPYSDSGRYTVEDNSILTIINISRSDNDRMFQCDVTIVDDNPASATDDLTLSVAFIDTPMFEIMSSPVIEGESVMFTCSVNANPFPEIIVYKDVTEITRETTTNLTYKIDNVARSDAGNYKCEASNIADSGTSQVHQLEVYYKPEFDLDEEITVVPGEVVVIEPLDVSANPNDITYQWTTDPPGINDTDTNPATFTFKVSESAEDGKIYTITVNVDNSIGSTIKSVKITVANPCSDKPCENGGICTVVEGGYNCSCTDDFNGLNCSKCIYKDGCDLSEGDIYYSEGNGTCGCICGACRQFDNNTNRCESIDYCTPNECKNEGNCSTAVNCTFTCECQPGYNGSLCENEVSNPCEPNPCDGETCFITDQDPAYKCCPNGTSGYNCTESTCSLQCTNGSTCQIVNNTEECLCPSVFEGQYCERNTSDGNKSIPTPTPVGEETATTGITRPTLSSYTTANNTDSADDGVSGLSTVAKVAIGGGTCITVLGCIYCFYCWYAGKCCFSKNKPQTLDHNPPDDVEMDKAEGKSDLERYQASGGELYTQVNLQQKKKKPDSDNGSNKPAPVDLNAEGLQYADLDLTRNCPAGKQDVINHPDSETMYSSITHQI